MPSEKKIIAIIGATGAQGGGLVRAILNDGDRSEFAVRPIARSGASERAKLLDKLGTKVVEVDINDENALTKAIRGCYGMYCVSFFWDHMSPDEEIRQARNMANAAKKAGLKHVVWSTFEDSRKMASLKQEELPTLMGKFKVPHCDAKAEGDRFFAESGVPTTYMVTDFYWDNFIIWGMGPKKTSDGRLLISLPMANKRLPGIAAEDIGKCALGIFKRPSEYANKRIGVIGEALTVAEMAKKMSTKLGVQIDYNDISIDTYRLSNVPASNELANMFKFFQDCENELLANRSVDETRKLNPDLMNFDQWLDRYKDHFPVKDFE